MLELIRGKSVAEARTILQFCDRAAAEPIAKVLDSAVANAANNNDIPPEELFVTTCYADEGPTLKRWRPRARGRATRIRKRTCHITVIVGRYSPDELDKLRERQARTGRTAPDASASRARRVARSRSKETAATAEGDAPSGDEDATTDEDAHDEEATTAVVADSSAEAAEEGNDTVEPTDDENARDAEATEEVVADSSAEAAEDGADAEADAADATATEKKDED